MDFMIIKDKQNESHIIKAAECLIHAQDFREIALNTWECHMEGWGAVTYVALSDIENPIVRSMEPVLNQWDYKDDTLTVISENKPEVWYGRLSEACVLVKDSEDITIDLTARRAGLGIRVANSKNITIMSEGHHIGTGIYCENSSIIVPGFNFNHMTQKAVSFWGDCSGSRVMSGYGSDCGMSESSATVYAGNTKGRVTIENVTAVRQHYGNYWKWDGAGFYADNGSENIMLKNNTAIDCVRAMHDNSGHENFWLNNKRLNCDEGLKVTDVHSHNKGVPVECGTVVL